MGEPVTIRMDAPGYWAINSSDSRSVRRMLPSPNVSWEYSRILGGAARKAEGLNVSPVPCRATSSAGVQNSGPPAPGAVPDVLVFISALLGSRAIRTRGLSSELNVLLRKSVRPNYPSLKWVADSFSAELGHKFPEKGTGSCAFVIELGWNNSSYAAENVWCQLVA